MPVPGADMTKVPGTVVSRTPFRFLHSLPSAALSFRAQQCHSERQRRIWYRAPSLSFRAQHCHSECSIVILSVSEESVAEGRPKRYPLIWSLCAEASVRQRLCALMMPYRAYIEGSVRRDVDRAASLRIRQPFSIRISVP